MVDVFQKQVQRRDTLREPALNGRPLGTGDDARQQVMRKDALGTFIPAVDGERNSLVKEGEVGLLLTLAKLVGGNAQKSLKQLLIVRPRLRVRAEHLVVGVV